MWGFGTGSRGAWAGALLLVGSLLVCGCSSRRGGVELLEARLRVQEDALAEADSKLQTVQRELTVARRESQSLRVQLASRGDAVLLPEQADQMHRVTGIEFSSLLTAGVDRDGVPGDEGLTAVVAPHDAEGELVKLPGRLELEVLDLSRPRGEQRIGRWAYSVEESRELWHAGFMSSGFQVDVPWQGTPASQDLVLHARFTTIDERRFDVQTELRINPPAVATRRTRAVSSRGGYPRLLDGPEPNRQIPGAPVRSPDVLPANRIGEPRRIPEGPAIPRPLPEGPVRTSDSWTDETIPRLR